MTKRLSYIVRRIVPLMSAGLLFQANGCTTDINSLVAGLASTIVSNFITSYVYGAFNVGQ